MSRALSIVPWVCSSYPARVKCLGAEENGKRKSLYEPVHGTAPERLSVTSTSNCDLARKRGKKIHSSEKHNVMKTGVLWYEIAQRIFSEEYSDLDANHILADNCAMQLVRDPKQFDVLVTDNLFGDMLSDEAAMMTGSLGMLPSASLGAEENGTRKALYEPVHGTAPDIAGKALANPIATIASLGMSLRYSFGMGEAADIIDQAIATVLESGLRTADIMQDGCKQVSTGEMGAAIKAEMDKLAA